MSFTAYLSVSSYTSVFVVLHKNMSGTEFSLSRDPSPLALDHINFFSLKVKRRFDLSALMGDFVCSVMFKCLNLVMK